MQPIAKQRLPLRAFGSSHIVFYKAIVCTLFGGMLSCSVIAQAQTSSAQQTNAAAILQQIWTVFAAGNSVSQVQLTGSATWYAGGAVDSGTATLTAASSGAAQMQLSLAQKGTWVESESAFGMGMDCQWSGTDGVLHTGDFMNCLKPAVWFLPSISLQPPSLPTGVGVSDLGTGTVGPGTYRHLQIQAVLADIPSYLLSPTMTASTTDIGFDPNTLLPAVLLWQVHPDNGAQINVPIEIRYSNYQKVSGIEIPFSVQRYVNGALQLDIQVTSVQFS
jgi:hypothetical protein